MSRVRVVSTKKPRAPRPDHIFLLLSEGVSPEEAQTIRSKILRASTSARELVATINDFDGVASLNSIVKVPLVTRRRKPRVVED